jgi:thymidylate kinase
VTTVSTERVVPFACGARPARRLARPASIDDVPATRSTRPRGLLIAAEGLDGSGKSAGLDALGRWLERKGRRVHLVTWEPSRLVARAAVAPRGRQALTPRVAALLAASEAADRITADVARSLVRGDVVLADRYAWTGMAREVARGLDPTWAAAIYRFLPRPDLVIFHRQEPAAAIARALATRPTPVGAEAVAAAYSAFLERLITAYDRLLADPAGGPWPTVTLVLDPRAASAIRVDAVRAAVRPLLDNADGALASAFAR